MRKIDAKHKTGKTGEPKDGAKVTLAKIKHRPIQVAGAAKRDVRTQFGALCYRLHGDKVEILLITSRGRGNWIIPKGWPIAGQTPGATAATEAMQEAGAIGKVSDRVLGFYSYSKTHEGDNLPCVVAVFPLKVKKLQKSYNEEKQRERIWVSQKKAINMIKEPELRRLIKDFQPTEPLSKEKK